MTHDDHDEHDQDDRADGAGPLDLRAWTAPPAPGSLADGVMARVAGEPPVDARAAIATAREPLPPRRTWPRYLVVAAGSAALAATATWWLVGRAPPRTADVAVTPTAGTVEIASSAGARVRITTPLAVIETGPGPARLVLSPLSPDQMEVDVNRTRALAIGGGAALLAGGIALAVHEGSARVGTDGDGPRSVVASGQSLTLEPSVPAPPATTLRVAHATKDASLRAQVASAIAAARTRREQAKASARTAGPGSTPAQAVGPDTDEFAPLPLSKEQIRTGIREVVPMLADCYQQELLDRGVAVEGTVIAHLIVESDPDIGAVVTLDDQQPSEVRFDVRTVEPGPGATLRTPAGTSAAIRSFGECFDLTLETVVLPPLPAGGRLSITYPFTFAPGDEDDGDDGPAASERPRAPAP